LSSSLLIDTICRPFRTGRSGWWSRGLKSWADFSCTYGAVPPGHILTLGVLAFFWLVGSAFAEEAVIFAHYNVENYLEMNRREGGSTLFGPKPAGETNTLIRIIKEIHPDILGVAEMGPPDQFQDFQKRLKEAGLEFPFTEYVSGADHDRHLALLSRFRIVERHSENDPFFDLNGQRELVERGFLDATIEVNPTFRLRVVGAHLKSKLAVPSGEALLRRNEARLLRQHIDGVLSKDPNEKLLVYGDLNDTKDQPAIQEVLSPRQGPNRLKEIVLTDAQGDRWTYYRRLSDTYDRIDYILADQALLPQIDQSHSYLYRSADWYSASDHRPVVVVIRVGP
jgi:endonuclease/exonuclease/phosphatase family metal-dependent hydrolase